MINVSYNNDNIYDDVSDDDDDDDVSVNKDDRLYLLAIKSNGKFSGNANDDISPMDGLYNKSKASISGKASPDNNVDGAFAITFLLLSSSILVLLLPALNKLSSV